MGKVHYIGWYIAEGDEQMYSGNVPGMLKMRYVAARILEADKELSIFSLVSSKKLGFSRNKRIHRGNFDIVYSGGFTGNSKIGTTINDTIKKILFVFYVFFFVSSTDTIILYHSVRYTSILAKLRKIVNRHIILEVEEVYGYAAQGDNKKNLDIEFRTIPLMDEFIIINDYLQKEFNLPIDRCVPCYGVAVIPERRVERQNDGYIHVVYAGTIEGRKQGAYLTVEASEFLPDNYKVHIVGFGNDINVSILKDKINQINSTRGKKIVDFLGYKSGDELDDFLYTCHIGASTYVMREQFANNSLPSKVFTYMCHDLGVVRGRATAFEGLKVADYWHFYDKGEPQDVANAIVKARIPDKGECVDFIKSCDRQLISFLRKYCS